MSPRQYLPKIIRSIVITVSLVTGLPVTEALAQQSETAEIVFAGSDAQSLVDKAVQLGNAVAIYEYVHNHFEFAAYHGSRSGSINTFMGRRGSDVDIATALIAMLRSQNIPARYAVATVRIPAAKLINWLGVGNLDVAVQVLKDQGIQGVMLSTDRSTADLEHVWTEVLVPFNQYRGLTTNTSVDCSQPANVSHCNWIPLDGSFKQKTYNGLNIDPYNALSFDYTGYYNAIKDSAIDPLQRKDKSPLTILEEQIATWLRISNPGKTLEDVADAGQIVEIHDGLLPASLPFAVTNTIRHYDSVVLHDAVVPAREPKKWAKSLSVGIDMTIPTSGAPITKTGQISLLLAQLNTKRLTLATEFPSPGNTPNVVTRWGGSEVARPISGNGTIPGYTPALGDPFTITIDMDGRPDPTGGIDDQTITASYSASVGGYYLVAPGGEYSNWSQVHRAADQLLADNANYKIVINPADPGSNGQPCDFASGLNCTPYVDATGNGWDASDLSLLYDKSALDALTGGLLYVAANQYYAKLRDQFERADRLMKTKTPIIGIPGVVSSFYDVEYIDDTAFAVLPGGLLIDIKSLRTGGSYRTHEATLKDSNRQFEFLIHIGSSLEHEVWQELTGYDAVSTVRGIQMALAGGATLLNPKKNSTEDTLPELYSAFGFNSTVPSGFIYTPLSVYSTSPTTWTYVTSGSAFETLLSKISAGAIGTRQAEFRSYTYSDTSGLYAWSTCADYWEGQLQAYYNVNGNASIAPISLCNQTFSGPVLTVISQFQSYWLNTIIPSYIGQSYFDYFDLNKGFTTTGRVYRSYPPVKNAYPAATIADIRNNLYIQVLNDSWIEYLLPSTLVAGPNNYFEVSIRKDYDATTGDLFNMTFKIINYGN